MCKFVLILFLFSTLSTYSQTDSNCVLIESKTQILVEDSLQLRVINEFLNDSNSQRFIILKNDILYDIRLDSISSNIFTNIDNKVIIFSLAKNSINLEHLKFIDEHSYMIVGPNMTFPANSTYFAYKNKKNAMSTFYITNLDLINCLNENDKDKVLVFLKLLELLKLSY